MKARTLPVLLLVALSLLLAPTPASAGTHDNHRDNTQLVWSRVMDSSGSRVQLVISDPRGQGLRELTRPAEGARDIEASISPDGRLVAFERDYPDNVQILIIGTDGRGEREVPHRLHRPVR